MKVLALDLSLTSTGVAMPDGTPAVWSPPSAQARGMDRLHWFRTCVQLWAALGDGRPDLVVLEGYSFGTARQASHAHALGELGGIVRMALRDADLPYAEVPPASLKRYATGKGGAKKELMLVEAVKRLGYDGSSNDEVDALWLRAMALDAYGEPVVAMPQANREAIGGVLWPVLGGIEACSA